MATGQAPNFAALLKRYRRAAGLTQEALAEQAHLSVYTVSALERGVNQTPRKDTVALLADALELPPRERAALEAAARGLSAVTEGPPHAIARTTTSLVGRSQELALLDRHLADAGPPVLLLTGEPGIGKSRLLHEAARRGAAAGWRVLTGGCRRRGGQEPYAPLLEALQHYLRAQPPARLRAELRGCAWLVRLLPELAAGPIEPLPTWTLAPQQKRRLMVEAVAHLLANVAGSAGTLLLLDDLQWSGPDALDVLATLVRAAGSLPLRVVGAYRETEVQAHDPLALLLTDLAPAGLAARWQLGPLTPKEAAQLLDGLLVELDEGATVPRERVLERAGGVPFFVVSGVEALSSDADHGGAGAVPWGVAQSIRQRMVALPAAARELLGVAAVVGRVVRRYRRAAGLTQETLAERARLSAYTIGGTHCRPSRHTRRHGVRR